MEQPHDLLLSTLNAYLQAIGGTARMMASFTDGHEPVGADTGRTTTRGSAS